MPTQTIPPREVPGLLAEACTVIDVRTPAEFKSAHVDGAVLHPLDEFDPVAFCSSHGTDDPVYILCQSGKRAGIAAEKLRAAGHGKVFVVEGGTAAAIEDGLDIVYGKKAISIERQVRIAAGGLVFLGTLAGLFIHGGFLAVPAFIGAGLVFAGVTDTCGMGMMIAKMPWNR